MLDSPTKKGHYEAAVFIESQMTYKVILTNDYEILGNGSGSPLELMIEPTHDLCLYLDRWGIKHTIFFDVLEYIRFKESRQKEIFEHYDYDIRIKEQLQELYLSGHDVQLHIHPQWINARHKERYGWAVDASLWSIGSISSVQTLDELIGVCKNELERIIQEVDVGYKCIAFRAGAYGIQPENKVLEALVNNGILIDSSVTLGRANRRKPNNFDYRNAPAFIAHWRVDRDVTTPAIDGRLIELPISTTRQSRFNYKTGNKKFRSIIKRAVFPSLVNIDFCKFTSTELIESVKRRIRQIDDNITNTPIVLIGHSKDWKSDEINHFNNWVTSHSEIQFATISEWYRNYVEAT